MGGFIYSDEDLKRFCEKRNLKFVERRDNSKVAFVCNIHPQKGIQEMKITNLRSGKTCGCAHRNYTKDDLLNNKKFPKNIEIIGEYVNDSTPILVKCKECGKEWKVEPNRLINGRTCSGCNKIARDKKNRENFLKKIELLAYDITIISEYQSVYKPITYICNKCGNVYTISYAGNLLKRKPPCNYCNKSLGEGIIGDWLENHHIEYIRECVFDKCIYKENLHYDFYLPNENMAIEYQGEQHYFPVNFKGGKHNPTEEFKNNQIRDNIKREYCQNHNIKLVEIPYFEKNNIATILSELLL